jgi:WD40 repeat protein
MKRRGALSAGLLLAQFLASCSEPQAPLQLEQEFVLEAISAQEQFLPLLGSVTDLPRVRVVDAKGNPQQGIRVYFVRSLGRPAIDGAIRASGPTGEVSLSFWHVGTRAGPQEVSAVVVNNSSDTRAVFRVNVLPGPASFVGLSRDTVRIAVGESSTQLSLAHRDDYGNIVSIIPGATLTSDDASIVEVLPDGSLRGVATGRAAVVVDSGAFRRAALAIVGNPPDGSVATIATIPSPENQMYAVAVDPTGLTFTAPYEIGSMSPLIRIAPGGGTVTTTSVPANRLVDAAIVPDDSRVLFVGLEQSSLLVVNSTTGTVAQTVSLPDYAYRVAVSADGSFAIVTGASQVWRVELADYEITTFPLPPSAGVINGVDIHPVDGRIFLASHSGYVAVLDGSTGAQLHYFGGIERAQGVAVDAAGNRLYVGRENYGIRVYDATTLAHISDSNPFSGSFDLRWHAARNELWVSLGSASAVLRFSPSALIPLERFGIPGARRMAFLPNGDVAVASTGALRLIQP